MNLASQHSRWLPIVPGRWVFAYELNPGSSIARYKARWVAKGFEQTEGIDLFVTCPHGECYSPSGAKNGMIIEHSDVDTAFFESKLKADVWVE